MSGYKHVFKSGEKAQYIKATGYVRECLITRGGHSKECAYFLKVKGKDSWIKNKDGNRITFEGQRSRLTPRGKKATARYAKCLAEWESEQVVEFKKGDWVCRHRKGCDSIAVGTVLQIDSIGYSAKSLRFKSQPFGLLAENFRHATPEEIAAATRTVWNLEENDLCFIVLMDGAVAPIIWDPEEDDYLNARQRGLITLTKYEGIAVDDLRVKVQAELREVVG